MKLLLLWNNCNRHDDADNLKQFKQIFWVRKVNLSNNKQCFITDWQLYWLLRLNDLPRNPCKKLFDRSRTLISSLRVIEFSDEFMCECYHKRELLQNLNTSQRIRIWDCWSKVVDQLLVGSSCFPIRACMPSVILAIIGYLKSWKFTGLK